MRRTSSLFAFLFVLVVALVGVVLASDEASSAQSVTVRVVDQHGVEIPGSEVLPPSPATKVATGESITIDPGTHSFTIYPGVAGRSSTSTWRLVRTESVVVDSTTTSIDFTWMTSDVTLNLLDQHGSHIPGSSGELVSPGWAPPIDTGGTIALPITDESVYPTMAGAWVEGYDLWWSVGIRGWSGRLTLSRTEVQEVPAQTDPAVPIDSTFEWITSDVEFHLLDQFGSDIDGSKANLIYNGWGAQPRIETGETITLPVTDESVYPTMSGNQKDGYLLEWFVGVRGAPASSGAGTHLSRFESQEVPVQIDPGVPIDSTYEWITSEVEIHLVDQYGQDIPGSALNYIFRAGWNGPIWDTGSTFTLPITDESVYPTMRGLEKDGFHFFWYPGLMGFRMATGAGIHLMRSMQQEVPIQSDAGVPIDSTLEWITSDVEFHLLDQHGADIPGARAGLIFGNAWLGNKIQNGESVTMPITDEGLYRSMIGNQADGYDVYWNPGLNGSPTGYYTLHRLTQDEVHAGTTSITNEWWVQSCYAQLVDVFGDPVEGSHLRMFAYGPWTSGTEYRYPVNSTSDYPDAWGSYADGYVFDIYPVYPGEETEVPLVFRADGTIEPPTFDIDGSTYSFSCNRPPTADAGGPYAVDEGGAIALTASGVDPEGAALTYDWDLDGDGIFETPGQSVSFDAYGLDGPDSVTVAVAVSDGYRTTVATTDVTVLNVAPSIVSVTPPIGPQEVGTQVTVDAVFEDPGKALDGPYECEMTFGDGSGTYTRTITEDTCSVDHAFDAPGVYSIGVSVSDNDGGTSIADASAFVVVFDPSGGHVTGGGAIASSPGAYIADPSVEGRATFGFVAKYHKGAEVPQGNTQFVFHAGDLRFHSDDYQWLVVAGSNAIFKGTGAINGADGYGFMLSAIDADLNSNDAHELDRFRIKIWDLSTESVVYDNSLGSDVGDNSATAITSGQIRIHR